MASRRPGSLLLKLEELANLIIRGVESGTKPIGEAANAAKEASKETLMTVKESNEAAIPVMKNLSEKVCGASKSGKESHEEILIAVKESRQATEPAIDKLTEAIEKHGEFSIKRAVTNGFVGFLVGTGIAETLKGWFGEGKPIDQPAGTKQPATKDEPIDRPACTKQCVGEADKKADSVDKGGAVSDGGISD